MAEVKNNTINGECSKCGECCTNVLLVRQDEINKIRKYLRQNKVQPNYKDGVRCPFLSEKKLCNIYQVRPQICKTFSCAFWCKGKTYMDYRNVKAINMLSTFFPNEECPNIGIDLEYVNSRLKDLNKKIYKNK